MTAPNRAWLGAAALLALAVLAVGGLWLQKARATASQRAEVVRAAEIELDRETIERAALVTAGQRLDQLALTDPDPSLTRLRLRVALELRLPDVATARADQLLLERQPTPGDRLLAARAYALRHALAGRQDDARRAFGLAELAFEATRDREAGLLAWQCAVRIGDEERAARAAGLLEGAHPEAWETQVAKALAAFDPQQAEAGATLRELQRGGPPLPELELAVATLDLQAADENARGQGAATVRRVLDEVPAFQMARVLAVLVCAQEGDIAGRNAHLQWLLQNYPADPRADHWRELLER